MAAATPLYADLAKDVNDFFTTGYNFDTTVSVKSVADGVNFESGVKVVKKESSGFLKGEYKNAKFGKVTGESWTTGVAKASVTFDKAVKNSKVALKVNSAKAAKAELPTGFVGIDYVQPQYTASANVDFDKKKALVSVAGVFRQENLSFGAEAKLAAHGQEKGEDAFKGFSVGLRYATPSYVAVLQSSNTGKIGHCPQNLSLSYLFASKQNYSVAAKFQYSKVDKDTVSDLEIASLYETRDQAKLRFKANTKGVLVASYATRLANPNVEVVGTVESDIASFEAKKVGLKVVF